MIQDADLLKLFNRGLIPGPGESEEAFLKRTLQAQPLSHPEWKEVKTPFGFTIDWVPLTYSNHRIAWWEGAATWISDDLPSIQLRRNFQKGFFLGYRRSDILAHEAVHAVRVRFEEPQFEEILAYSTSKGWKKFFGPLFSRTWEPLVFILSLALGIFSPFIPLLVLSVSLGWLLYRQWAFKRCAKKLSPSLMLCLTDAEIRKFARMQTSESILSADASPLSRLKRLLWNLRTT